MELSWQLGDEGPHHAVLASLSSQCDVDEEVEVGYDKEEKNVFDAHAFARCTVKKKTPTHTTWGLLVRRHSISI